MAAYMTGVKMNNEVISMSADTKATDANGKPYHASYDATCPAGNGTPVETLLEIMKARAAPAWSRPPASRTRRPPPPTRTSATAMPRTPLPPRWCSAAPASTPG